MRISATSTNRRARWLGPLATLLALTACTAGADNTASQPELPSDVAATRPAHAADATAAAPTTAPSQQKPKVTGPFRRPLPGMPPVRRNNIYAETRAGMLSAAVRKDPAYVYVPDSDGSTVTVIDQHTLKVVRVLDAGQLAQHVGPSYDLTRLYANTSVANQLTVVDPRTARVQRRISVPRPYNMYFAPDGREAVVAVEQHDQLLFADARAFNHRDRVALPRCEGPNHLDFSGNGRFFLLSCEFSGTLLKVSTLEHEVIDVLRLPTGSMPQDVRLSPDGTVFYVADMGRDVVRLIDARPLHQVGSISTPNDPHGLTPSRGGRLLYVSDRGAGKVSVVSFETRRIVDTWRIPGGGSPDMGGVSAGGARLWLSGRYDGVVYVFNTRTGRLVGRVQVGGSPHGLCVWPQPGRYSLGHTGNMR